MNNILVTGSNGQLGSELRLISKNYLDYTFFFTDAEDLDITNYDLVKKYINHNKINVIINCAAFTNVDEAEIKPEIADKINHLAVANLANLAIDKKIKLIHLSTDYVFDGTGKEPYSEIDEAIPISVYGKTKLLGELALQQINPANSLILRTSWLYSKFGNNFLKTMIRLSKESDEIKVVNDQIGTPTNAADLSKAILTILPQINNEIVELFHYSNEGECSWFDFAKAIFEINKNKITLKSVKSSQYFKPAQRPKFSILSKKKIKNKYKLFIPHWRDSLKRVLEGLPHS